MRGTRRLLPFVLAAAAFAASLTPGASGQAAADPPLNVVLLILDDVRWDAIGAAGNRVVRTPAIDALAADGVRFEQARVTTAICMVSRASLLTGQYMSRHGITAFGKAIPEPAFAATYPGALRRAGYWSGYVGKYGVGKPREEDFDFLRPYEGRHWITTGSGERVHVTEKNARDAVEFLRGRPAEKPFLLTVGFFAAHAEDSAPEQYLPQDWSGKLYEGVSIPPPLRGAPAYRAALPPFLSSETNEGRVRYHWRFDTAESYQAYMTRYYRLITEADAAIGRIGEELRAQGVYDRTIIVVVGDNGYFQADRGLADKWYPYEESMRVPLVVRDPRLPRARRGQARKELALNIDVAPTLMAAAGIEPSAAAQGRDLGPLYLARPAPRWRDEFLYEHPTVLGADRIPESRAVVRRDWKYVEWPGFDYRQLFDLVRDPGELHNLAGQPRYARREALLRQRLEAWRQRAR